jgi:hypothetical protein
MASVLDEYLVSLGFQVDDEAGFAQALQRAGQRVKAFNDLQTQYGKLGVQVVKEAIKERETVEKALQVTVERGLKERERLGNAVERALTRAVTLGNQERARIAREAERALARTVQEGNRERIRTTRDLERDHLRAEREKEQATERTHRIMLRALTAITAASTTAFYAIKKSTDELVTLHDVSDRTGASIGNIRALQDAYRKVGLSANEAASDIENLASKGRTDFGARGLRQAFGVDLKADPTDQMFQIVDKLKARFGNQGPAGYAIAAQLAEQMGLRENLLERVWNRGPEMRAELERSLAIRKDQNERGEESKDLYNSINNLWRKAREELEAAFLGTGAFPRMTKAINELADSKIPYAALAFVAAGSALTLLAAAATFATARLATRALLGGSLFGGAGRLPPAPPVVPLGGGGPGIFGTILRGLGLAGLAGGGAMIGGSFLEKLLPSPQHDLTKVPPETWKNLRDNRERSKKFFGDIGIGGAQAAAGKVEVALTEEDVQRLEKSQMPSAVQASIGETPSILRRIESLAHDTVEAIKDLSKGAERKGLINTLFGGPGGVGMGGAGGTGGIAGGGGIDTGGAGGRSGSSIIGGRAAAGRARQFGPGRAPGYLHTRQEVDKLIEDEAAKRGIPAEPFKAIFRREGASRYTGDPDARGAPTSFGPFQIHRGEIAVGRNTARGLGDQFFKETGLDPADPKTVRQQVQWQMNKAIELGSSFWGHYHGLGGQNFGALRGTQQRLTAVEDYKPSAGTPALFAEGGAGGVGGLIGRPHGGQLGGALGEALGGSGLYVTSGKRAWGVSGSHQEGRAFDVRARTPGEADAAMEKIRGLMSERGLVQGRDYKFVDEVRHRSPMWTGPHLHTEFLSPRARTAFKGDGEKEGGGGLLSMSAQAAERIRQPRLAIAPAPSNTVSNKTNDIKMDNDVNITVHGNADADMIAAGVSRKQRQWGDDLLRRVEGSSR